MPALDQPATVQPNTDRDITTVPRQLRPHKVILFNCDCHSYRDVIVTLCVCVPSMTAEQALRHATTVDTTGSDVVARLPKARAEDVAHRIARTGLQVRVEEGA